MPEKREEEEEFSDISESEDDGGSSGNEASLVGLTISDPEVSDAESHVTAESRDTSLDVSRTTSCDVSRATSCDMSRDVSHESVITSPITMDAANTITISHPPAATSRLCQSSLHISNLVIRQTLRKTSLATRNMRAKEKQKREHQMPHPVTPDIPDSPAAPKQHQPLWNRFRRVERSITSPSICCYNDTLVRSPLLDGRREADAYSLDHVIQGAARPSNRTEKRRVSVKSSCSIPSFSTPAQALLLIGMKPNSKTQNRTFAKPPPRRPMQSKASLSSKDRESNHETGKGNVLELPALSVNGAGDLVIRKKQIISG